MLCDQNMDVIERAHHVARSTLLTPRLLKSHSSSHQKSDTTSQSNNVSFSFAIMSTDTNTTSGKRSILEPMDLHNQAEFDELLHQRILCGWQNSSADLIAWRELAEKDILFNFWIVPASSQQLPAPQRYAGHISMSHKFEDLGNTPVRHIANLFILPEHRLGGLGRQAVKALEALAKDVGVKRMSLNALCRRYVEDDAEEWRPMYLRFCSSIGIELPAKGSSNEDWYVRQGYVVYGEMPMLPAELDGKKFLLVASLLRKDLG